MCLLFIALHLDIGNPVSYGDICTPTVREFEIWKNCFVIKIPENRLDAITKNSLKSIILKLFKDCVVCGIGSLNHDAQI